jgi:hypothetical protein
LAGQRSRTASLDRATSLIQRAISELGENGATQDARGHLRAALAGIERVHGRRSRRQQTHFQQYAQRAISMHADWWSKIEENVRKAAEQAVKFDDPKLSSSE